MAVHRGPDPCAIARLAGVVAESECVARQWDASGRFAAAVEAVAGTSVAADNPVVVARTGLALAVAVDKVVVVGCGRRVAEEADRTLRKVACLVVGLDRARPCVLGRMPEFARAPG